MLIFGALIMVGISVFLILEPIIRGREAPLTSREVEASEAQFKKRVSLLQLRDAEYEYAMGKLGEEDYQKLRKEISAEALAAIRESETELKGEAGAYVQAAAELEAEIAQVRARLRTGAFCQECGTPNPKDSRFCSECGTPLQVPQPSGQA